MGYIAGVDSIYTLTRGRKKYEASNHLGNVMVVFTDKRINQCINDSVQYYRADLRSAYDYYPFGMLIPDRTFDSVAYVQLPDRVDTTINQRIKIQIPTLNPGQIISLRKDGETYVLAQYQSGYTGAQYSANIAGSAIVNELSFEDSAGYLIIENTTLGGQSICLGIPSFSLNIAGTNYVVNCSQSIDTIRGGLLSEAGYLFGYNGMELDDELKGNGNSLNFGARIYDSRIAMFITVDPRAQEFPWMSSFCFAANNPIRLIDSNGEGPDDPLRLIFYGGARDEEENNAFKYAGLNVANDYSNFSKENFIRINSAREIVDKINSQKSNSIQSIDILTHGGTNALYAANTNLPWYVSSNTSLYRSKSKQFFNAGWSNGSAILDEINFDNFTKNAKIELHGCMTCDKSSPNDNIASDLSKRLFLAGKTEAVVIGHSTETDPLINGEPVKDKKGKHISGTTTLQQDYRHKERIVYHNGSVLFTTKIKGRISASVINSYLEKKKKTGDSYDGTKEVYVKSKSKKD